MHLRLAPLLLLLVCQATLAAPPPLPDQYGQELGLNEFAGQSVLVIVVNARKLRHIKKWEEKLRKSLPTLVSMRVADINDEPPPTFDQVATQIKERAPEGVSILVDMQSQWSATYNLDTDEPCLLLLDPDHTEVQRFRGRANKANVSTVLTALRETGLAGGTTP